MRRARRTRFIDWAVCLIFLFAGLFLLAGAQYSRWHGTTPESELTVVSGPATESTVSRRGGRLGGSTTEYLRFTVAGQTVNYSMTMPDYPDVRAAVTTGQTLTLGVSVRRETLLPHDDWVALYTLAIGPRQVLTYQGTLVNGYRGSNAPYIVIAALLLISSWGLHTCYKNRNPSRVVESARPSLQM